jgi:hypothetical protein
MLGDLDIFGRGVDYTMSASLQGTLELDSVSILSSLD